MNDRPYTLLSCAVSLDGYLTGPNGTRLSLSNAADLERVDAVRGSSDAILVGAATVRNDDPRLLVRSPARSEARVAQGQPGSPTKVTVTRSGRLDSTAHFFSTGDVEKLVYCPAVVVDRTRDRLGAAATVVACGETVDMRRIGEDLSSRGVRRLMVEGGGSLLTQFLTQDLADELQLVIAPLFVGGAGARRFVDGGDFPWQPGQRATLAETRQLGDVVLLRYALSTRFRADQPQEA